MQLKHIKLFEDFDQLTDDELDRLGDLGLDPRKKVALRKLKAIFARLELPTELEFVESSDEPSIGDYFSWDAFNGVIDPIMVSVNDEGEVGFSWDSVPLSVSAHTRQDNARMWQTLEEVPISIDLITDEDVITIWKEINSEWGEGSVEDDEDEVDESLDREEIDRLKELGLVVPTPENTCEILLDNASDHFGFIHPLRRGPIIPIEWDEVMEFTDRPYSPDADIMIGVQDQIDPDDPDPDDQVALAWLFSLHEAQKAGYEYLFDTEGRTLLDTATGNEVKDLPDWIKL